MYMIYECGSTLYVEMAWKKMAAHTFQLHASDKLKFLLIYMYYTDKLKYTYNFWYWVILWLTTLLLLHF